jgi:hypothetical protein
VETRDGQGRADSRRMCHRPFAQIPANRLEWPFFCHEIRSEYVINRETGDSDLAELSLGVLRRALEPGEDDPSRVQLVAALYVLGPGGAAPSGGIDVGEGAEEELDSLLSHLGREE